MDKITLTLTKLTGIYLWSFFLLHYVYSWQASSFPIPLFIKEKSERKLTQPSETYENFTQDKLSFLRTCFKSKSDCPGELIYHLVLGKPSSHQHFSAKKKSPEMKYYERLDLHHLFTPSGLHLTAFFTFLLSWTFLLPKSWQFFRSSLSTTLVVVICSFILFFLESSQFNSLKRMSLFRLLLLFFKDLKPETQNQTQNQTKIFFFFGVTFLIDFLWGTYDSSPMSFTYSFLFFGVILSLPGNSGLQMPALIPLLPSFHLFFALLGASIIIHFFQSTPLTFLGPLFNSLLSTLFTMIFPLLVIGLLFKGCVFLHYPFYFFHQLVKGSSRLAEWSGEFESSLPLVFLVIYFSMRMPFHNNIKKLDYVLLFLFLSLHSSQLPSKKWWLKEQHLPVFLPKMVVMKGEMSQFQRGEYTEKGLKIYFQHERCFIAVKQELGEKVMKCAHKKRKRREVKNKFSTSPLSSI